MHYVLYNFLVYTLIVSKVALPASQKALSLSAKACGLRHATFFERGIGCPGMHMIHWKVHN